MSLERRLDLILPLLRAVGAATGVLRAGDGVCVFANSRLEALYGMRGLAGKNVLEAHPDLRGAGLFERAEEVMRTGRQIGFDSLALLVEDEDGAGLRPAPFEVHLTPITSAPDAAADGVVIFARPLEIPETDEASSDDLARERRARRAAEANARRLQRLQEMTASLGEAHTSTAVGEVVLNNVVGAFGASVAELFVADRGRLRLLTAWPVAPASGAGGASPSDEAGARSPAELCAETGEAVFVESDDDAFAYTPMRWERSVIGVVGMRFRERHHFSSEDRAYFRSVADLCAQALHRAALYEAERRAKDEAIAASRVKDEFLATLSHELRTPLQSILGWARLLRSDLDEATMTRALRSIDRNARTQARLIADILDASRIVSGRMHVEKRVISPAEFVTVAVDMLRPEAETKGITVTTTLLDLPSSFTGDPGRLQQVVSNLVANAVKFTARGGRVDVTLQGAGGDLVLCVRDDGPGIAKDFLPLVFERFRQANAGITRAHGGLGLGLAIVRHIVELHAGSVMVESDGEGKGTKFTVRLPIVRATITQEDDDGKEGSTTDVTRTRGEKVDLDGVQVVVVDDDEGAREFVVSALEKFGARTRGAASAMDALSLLRAAKPDAIVSDIGMPEIDGYELVRRIRSLGPNDPLAAVPAIALSAYAREVERQDAFAAGFQLHLSKPVDPRTLALAVKGVIRR